MKPEPLLASSAHKLVGDKLQVMYTDVSLKAQVCP
jgi:hypothetical protein